MKRLVNKIKPVKGFSATAHSLLSIGYVLLLAALVKINLPALAVLTVVLSKWRIFAIKPRYWATHLKINMVDILFGVSVVGLLQIYAKDNYRQMLPILVSYIIWLLVIKPLSSRLGMSIQAVLAFILSVVVIHRIDALLSSSILALLSGISAYFCYSHYCSTSTFADAKSQTWAYTVIVIGLIYIFSKWLLFIWLMPAGLLMSLAIGYPLVTLGWTDAKPELTDRRTKQAMMVCVAISVLVFAFLDWQAAF
jgi:small-conductance mechanosensitive channel